MCMCLYVQMLHVCKFLLGPEEAWIAPPTPQDWSYRWTWAVGWGVLGANSVSRTLTTEPSLQSQKLTFCRVGWGHEGRNSFRLVVVVAGFPQKRPKSILTAPCGDILKRPSINWRDNSHQTDPKSYRWLLKILSFEVLLCKISFTCLFCVSLKTNEQRYSCGSQGWMSSLLLTRESWAWMHLLGWKAFETGFW